MGDYRRAEMSTMMDLDLNQEPLDLADDSVLGLGFLQDHEVLTARTGVLERIRQLENVYARARWRQTQNPSQNPLDNMVNDTSKGLKRDSSHLVAKALELDTDVTKVVGDGVGFFDCNICLDTVKDPVLTCCGHLFCWACFYRLPYVYSTAKECPVCKGEVTDSSVTPIYGNTSKAIKPEPDSGLKVPPRPRANRVESVRQNRVTRRLSQIPVVDALRRIRIGINGGMPDTRRQRTSMFRRAHAGSDDVAPANSLPRLFSGEFLTGNDDVEAERATRLPTFGFIFETPEFEVHTEVSADEPQAGSSSRRRNREARGRRRGPRS